jgi:hypothetical protein
MVNIVSGLIKKMLRCPEDSTQLPLQGAAAQIGTAVTEIPEFAAMHAPA